MRTTHIARVIIANKEVRKMTAAELKSHVEQGRDRFFFTRETMRFFGDTMSNYGVRDESDTWELYRKHPVKHGLCNSSYFDKETFQRVFK